MAVYRETDGDIVREYSLDETKPIVRTQGEFALLEWIPTKAFGLSLFLDNELQFAEIDEYIYHEMLVHPCLSFSRGRHSVCIVGGGDGCAAREVLKWSDVESIDLIDWDSNVTHFFQHEPSATQINKNALAHAQIENRNIQTCIHENRSYDCLLIDLLDPDLTEDLQVDLWYDVLFLAKQWINPGGSIVINLGGILPSNTGVVTTFTQLLQERIGLPYTLYKVFVPSFAREWCFALLGTSQKDQFEELPSELRYLSQQTWTAATTWSAEYLAHLNPVYSPERENGRDLLPAGAAP